MRCPTVYIAPGSVSRMAAALMVAPTAILAAVLAVGALLFVRPARSRVDPNLVPGSTVPQYDAADSTGVSEQSPSDASWTWCPHP